MAIQEEILHLFLVSLSFHGYLQSHTGKSCFHTFRVYILLFTTAIFMFTILYMAVDNRVFLFTSGLEAAGGVVTTLGDSGKHK